MFRRATITTVALALVAALAIMVMPAIGKKKPRREKLGIAALSGKQEVSPTTGKLDAGSKTGYGAGLIRAKRPTRRVCYRFVVHDLGAPGDVTAAHIHKEVAGKNGPIVLLLVSGPSELERGCVKPANDTEKSAAKDAFKNPENYYLNIHTKGHPDGAIRGQLSNGR
jgi:CHRD domain-containing protein